MKKITIYSTEIDFLKNLFDRKAFFVEMDFDDRRHADTDPVLDLDLDADNVLRIGRRDWGGFGENY